MVTARGTYPEDPAVLYPMRLFVRGARVQAVGSVPDRPLHLFGLTVPHEEQGVFLFGTDALGRDIFSRVVYGARLSLSIGLVGVFLSMTLGWSWAASRATMAGWWTTSSSA